jgi:RIO kinase 1
MGDELTQADAWDYDRYALEYGEYEEERQRRKKNAPPEKPLEPEQDAEADAPLPMTYVPARFEKQWLASSLRSFYQQHLITDVLSHVKGGKEASVYCCQASEVLEQTLLAAKVYRPREFRNLRNDVMYREGRAALTSDGKAAKKTDHRLMRAIGKKTAFGVQAAHTSWLMYEYTTLETLYKAGAAVPIPISAGENAILMGYQGDRNQPAPTLSQIRLQRREAVRLFEEVVRNIALLMEHEFIHGDLSAYNILYWDGAITLIDFPQVTSLRGNPNAEFIFRRDVIRVCEYFQGQGVECDAEAVIAQIWRDPESL